MLAGGEWGGGGVVADAREPPVVTNQCSLKPPTQAFSLGELICGLSLLIDLG